MKRHLFTKTDGLLLGIVLLLSIGLFAFLSLNKTDTLTAVVETAGGQVTEVELYRLSEPYTQRMEANGYTLTVEFSPDGVEVRSATCPDKCCVGQGKLTKVGSCTVCLPAGVVIRLAGDGERKVDAVL